MSDSSLYETTSALGWAAAVLAAVGAAVAGESTSTDASPFVGWWVFYPPLAS